MLETPSSPVRRASAPAPRLSERLAEADFGTCTVDELMNLAAACWSDVEISTVLRGSREFVWERLLHFGRRGYLTAQEEEGLRRTMAQLATRIKPEPSGEPA